MFRKRELYIATAVYICVFMRIYVFHFHDLLYRKGYHSGIPRAVQFQIDDITMTDMFGLKNTQLPEW
jgi:hypothetical protein